MPEFILDHGSSEASTTFAKLDSFTQGYVTALFFTALDWSDKDESDNPNDSPDWSLADLAPEAWARIKEDCDAFQESFADLLERAWDNESVEYSLERAGTDFLFTRNRHGAGFWDRGLGAVGDQLTKNAHPYGETNLYKGDDGKLYLS